MWFQEIKDLTETAAQDLLRGVMKFFLCRDRPELQKKQPSSEQDGSRLSARSDFLEGFFTRRSPLYAIAYGISREISFETPGSPVALPTFKLPDTMDSDA